MRHLGRKELLAPHAETLLRLLKGESPAKANFQPEAVGAWDWGPMPVARHLWRELGLSAIIDALVRSRGDRGECAERALALVSNRLGAPSSEHGIAFVGDRLRL